MLAQKLLEGLFTALDVVEEVRYAVARARGRPLPPPPWQAPPPDVPEAHTNTPAVEAPSPTTKKRRPATKPPPRRKDESGTAFSALSAAIDDGRVSAPGPDVAVDGKTMPGRILWALWHADKLVRRGLTGPEVAELLTHAGVKTAHNNIMRAVRQDEGRLFARAPGDGRAVLLTLTDEGREIAQRLLAGAG